MCVWCSGDRGHEEADDDTAGNILLVIAASVTVGDNVKFLRTCVTLDDADRAEAEEAVAQLEAVEHDAGGKLEKRAYKARHKAYNSHLAVEVVRLIVRLEELRAA